MNEAALLFGKRHTRLAATIGASIGVLTGIGGCTLEPHYQRPEAPVSREWPTGPAFAGASVEASHSTAPPAAAADIGWREFFTDPRLQKLIELALLRNPDARIAALNIAAARSQYQIQRADLFPTIAATGLEEVEKYPPSVLGIAAGSSGGAPVIGGSYSSTLR
jgi:multidrug efflux system outer membrane protein